MLLLALPLTSGAAAQATRDVAGSRDFAGIGRFAGSVISGYQVKDFDAARMQAAPFKDDQPADARRLEGKITRIAYRTNPGPSILEVSRNFETQLAKAGFEKLLDCDTDACGGIPFSEAVDALPIPQMWVDGFNYRYYAGRKTEGGRETYASVIVSENNRDIYAQLTIAELGAIENKMVDAAAMAKGWRGRPHRAVRHLLRHRQGGGEARKPPDPGADRQAAGPGRSSTSSSSATPTARARYDYNLDLSRRRAEAIAAELVKSTASRRRGCAPPGRRLPGADRLPTGRRPAAR